MAKQLPQRMSCPACRRTYAITPQDSAICYQHLSARRDVDLVPENGHPFQVGDGVHFSINGDSYPGTVRRVTKSGKTVWISMDDHVATQRARDKIKNEGFHEGPIDSIFTPVDVPEQSWRIFKLRKNGRFESNHASYTLHHGREYAQNPHV